jgi:Na+/H+ antiporter NhaC
MSHKRYTDEELERYFRDREARHSRIQANGPVDEKRQAIIVVGSIAGAAAAIILALAVTLKEVAEAVGTADYVVAMVGDLIPPFVLPGLLMVLCMLIAFSTGTSWGTYAVVFPVAVPLAWAIVPDPFFLTLCFAAVIGGSVFGDQCSPISDTTILSSLATGCDLMDHDYPQFPLAIAAGLLAMITYAVLVIVFV